MEPLHLAFSDDPVEYSTPTILLTQAPPLRRGARYSAYANLRELKLRGKLSISEEEFLLTPSPPKKTTTTPNVCKSVPNLSAALRKENRRPTAAASPLSHLPPRRTHVSMTKTPPPPLPPAKSALRRSGSISGGMMEEKKRTEVPKVRKSYACLKELRSFHDVNKPNTNGRGVETKTVGGVRRYI